MELFVAALATWQIVEIWHHSTLMAPLRARTEMWQNKLGELLGCPWCFSVWVGLVCGLVLATVDISLANRAGGVVLYGLAASRLANLGNDVFKSFCRTPGFSLDTDVESVD